jgi:hypothetical protein
LRYTSSGSVSKATPRQLREAGVEYADELFERYTQIPDTLPDRVVELARGLTSSFETPYDKAVAVRDFVQSYQYNLDIAGPPVGADGVDYFLFDLHQGYCDYYASSMAVMLRSQGIPARYVLGYAPGFLNNTGGYDVLQLNYHSWVEVYFPDYGWVRFEATPPEGIEFGGVQNPAAPFSSDEDDFDFGDGPFPEDDDDGSVISGAFDETNNAFFLTIGRMFVGLVGAGALFLALLYYRWWWRLGRLARVDELYAKMGRLATLLGLPASPAQTPTEYAEVLASELPEHAASIRVLASLYASRRYAGKPIPMPELRKAEIAWSAMRWALFRRLFRVKPA